MTVATDAGSGGVMNKVRIRDVRSGSTLDMSADERAPVLRVSNDLDSRRVAGPWYLDERGFATLRSGTSAGLRSGACEEVLGHCKPGDIVLMHLPDFDPTLDYDPLAWWLCELESIDASEAS